MTNNEPDVRDNGRYPVGEAAALLGVARSTLRRWINEGLIDVGFRKITCKKFITGSELKRVWREQY